MRISDWSSDVCSSDLTWTLRFSACPRRTAASSKCVSNKTTQGDTLCKIVQSFTSSAASAKSTPRKKSPTSTSPPTIPAGTRSEEHTSELQSLMRISYAVFCFKKKHQTNLHILQYLLISISITHTLSFHYDT